MGVDDSPRTRCRVIVTMNRGDAASPRRGQPLHFDDPLEPLGQTRPMRVGTMENIAYGVPGIDEEGGEHLRKRLLRLPGVHDVTVWLSQQQIDVSYDPSIVGPDALEDRMRQLGYMAQQIPWKQRAPG